MGKKVGVINKWLIQHVLRPWVLKRKGDALAVLMQQESFRNKITMALYNTRMGWDSINRALLGMGFKTVKAYYMMNGTPYLFFEMPNEERRKSLPAKLNMLSQPGDRK